jgi:hypothetical protein
MATTETTTKSPEVVKEIIATEEDSSGAAIEGFKDEATFLLKNQLIESLISNRDQRRRYARLTFVLTCTWITLVILIVALSGLDIRYKDFNGRVLILSDAVVITLITTTTLNVFGFFLLVMKYLFNTEELKEMKDIFLKGK